MANNNDQSTKMEPDAVTQWDKTAYRLNVKSEAFEKFILHFSGSGTDDEWYQAAVAMKTALDDIEETVKRKSEYKSKSALSFYGLAVSASWRMIPYLFRNAAEKVEDAAVKDAILFSRVTAYDDDGQQIDFDADQHYKDRDAFVRDVEELIGKD